MYLNNNTIIEDFEDEILLSFEKAEWEAAEPVDVIYIIDSKTGKDIELWKKDYLPTLI